MAIELKYTKDHEWIRVEDDIAVVGITDYAADQLGDVVYVDLPAAGTSVSAGKVIGEVESTKSVGEIFAPLDGEIVEVNEVVSENPELVNHDPFGAAWLVKIRFTNMPADLLDEAAYQALIAE
ncbi:MAG: glycine cleavage system protein GcvH [Microbacteriaceae bacterium]